MSLFLKIKTVQHFLGTNQSSPHENFQRNCDTKNWWVLPFCDSAQETFLVYYLLMPSKRLCLVCSAENRRTKFSNSCPPSQVFRCLAATAATFNTSLELCSKSLRTEAARKSALSRAARSFRYAESLSGNLRWGSLKLGPFEALVYSVVGIKRGLLNLKRATLTWEV